MEQVAHRIDAIIGDNTDEIAVSAGSLHSEDPSELEIPLIFTRPSHRDSLFDVEGLLILLATQCIQVVLLDYRVPRVDLIPYQKVLYFITHLSSDTFVATVWW